MEVSKSSPARKKFPISGMNQFSIKVHSRGNILNSRPKHAFEDLGNIVTHGSRWSRFHIENECHKIP